MSCWTCDCGYRNCDVDDCLNPKCPLIQKIDAVALAGALGVEDYDVIFKKALVFTGSMYHRDNIIQLSKEALLICSPTE